MATSETEIPPDAQASTGKAQTSVRSKKPESILDRFIGLLSSVRFGVTMLVIVLICAMIGMLVRQQSVEGFEQYYQHLTPSQRAIYGRLLFFDIYHAWYFLLFLAITGLNIILASIDRFPTAWQYVVKPKLQASPKFIRAQMFNTESGSDLPPMLLAEKVAASWRKLRFRPKISEENGRITVFGQRNVWNRLGAYSVHIALLTIFTGGVLTARLGVGGSMEIQPGRSANRISTVTATIDGPVGGQAELPFSVECTDLQQKLVRPEGNLDPGNTIDWLTYVTIRDAETGKASDALVHLNFPHDYGGYRFFQSSYIAAGNARQITVSFEPATGGPPLPPVVIPRNGAVDVPGIGQVRYKSFFADFDPRAGDSTSEGYDNPVAQLEITPPDGAKRGAMALNPQYADQVLGTVDKDSTSETALRDVLLVNGYKVLLTSFEKAPLSSILTVQYDPGRLPFYYGSVLLILSLCGVFFFSHQRAWAVIEPEGSGSKAFFGGNVNRNRNAFEGRFNLLVQSVSREETR